MNRTILYTRTCESVRSKNCLSRSYRASDMSYTNGTCVVHNLPLVGRATCVHMRENQYPETRVSYSATCLLTLVINVTWKALNEFGESRGSSCQLGRQSSHSFAPRPCFTSTVKGNVFWQNFRDSPCSCGQPLALYYNLNHGYNPHPSPLSTTFRRIQRSCARFDINYL